jgi:hypothetical protein
MNRPEKKNALTLAMYLEMTRALKEADAADATRCVVITGAGGTFCAGNDITDFLTASAGGGLDPRAHEFLLALARCRKPLSPRCGAPRSASARPCCCIAITSSRAPMRPCRRRS